MGSFRPTSQAPGEALGCCTRGFYSATLQMSALPTNKPYSRPGPSQRRYDQKRRFRKQLLGHGLTAEEVERVMSQAPPATFGREHAKKKALEILRLRDNARAQMAKQSLQEQLIDTAAARLEFPSLSSVPVERVQEYANKLVEVLDSVQSLTPTPLSADELKVQEDQSKRFYAVQTIMTKHGGLITSFAEDDTQGTGENLDRDAEDEGAMDEQ